jgi:hypothetical protein
MKDWSKERWRKVYLREALEQRLWSVMARGLRDYLIRLAEDDGALIRDSADPVAALLDELPKLLSTDTPPTPCESSHSTRPPASPHPTSPTSSPQRRSTRAPDWPEPAA